MKLLRRRRPAPLFDVDVLTPLEGVPLHLKVAGVGVRIAAQLTDLLLTLLAAAAIMILVTWAGLWDPQTWIALASMLFFITRIPYYVLTEIIWNGQTLGKRLLKLKVVDQHGGSLTIHALVVRNLLKEAEVFLPGTLLLTLDARTPVISLIAFAWIMGALLVPLLNKQRRRLGDFVAGTYVIHLPEPILLRDVSETKPQFSEKDKGFSFLSHQLDHYGAYELQTLEDLLRKSVLSNNAETQQRQKATRAKIVENIRRKIGYAKAIPEPEHQAFLQAFYNAQRAYLEQRQLFGERRADKFHGDTTDDGIRPAEQ